MGTYRLQAEIAAVHAHAERPDETDWPRIVELYDQLVALSPSPVVELNRAAAVAMAAGPSEGLSLIDRIEGLDDYYLLHAARADLLRRGGRNQEAAASYGASRTPEVFLFDAEHRLVYHGTPDSDHKDPQGAEPYLRQALDAALNGGEPAVSEVPPVGCTIKWRS